MTRGTLHGTGLVLLRSPARPTEAPSPRLTALPGDVDEVERTTDYLRALAADTGFREAVALSSPDLTDRLERALTPDGAPSLARLRRLALALVRYQRRAAARPTPVGTFAGVALGTVTDRTDGTEARLGESHRAYPRPDMRWLAALVAAHADRVEVLRHCRLRANERGTRRAGRLSLDDYGHAAPRVSVRLTGAVEEALRCAARPVTGAEVERRLAERFPTAPAESVAALLAHLVRHRFLLTDLLPPPDSTRPLAHVADRLGAAGLPEAAELRDIETALTSYDPRYGSDLDKVTARMRQLCPERRTVHVDLCLDARLRLPRTVTDEAARAAETLWRLSPGRHHPSNVREYHAEFLERYGVHRLVPLAELLDPTIGLGRPASYPLSTRPPVPRTEPRPERDRVLAELVQEAPLSDGVPEIRLGPAEVERLARTATEEVPLPPGLELGVRLVAPSVSAVDEGDFTLVLSGLDSPAVGATFGRFAYLFSEEEQTSLARSVAAGHPVDDPALPAQLSVDPFHPVAANLTRVPRWLEEGVAVDSYDPDRDALTLGDLAVGADSRRLYVVSLSRDREVRPVSLHMLNPKWAPAQLRFLTDIGAYGARRAWSRWDWGALEALPRLPRVRHGRTVLVPARWRLPERLHGEREFGRWRAEFTAWRSSSGLPTRVRLDEEDRDLPLDLDEPAHLRLLHTELVRRSEVALREDLDVPTGTGWLSGPGGAHSAELVVPLVRATPWRSAPVRSTTGRVRPAPTGRLPGEDWLYAKLYMAESAQPEVLATRLPALLAELSGRLDRWFFLRYRDPDPHLRLRLRGPSDTTRRSLHSWAAALRAEGLLSRVVWDTYDPEVERYGGIGALDAAEAVFAVDSAAALEQTALLHSGSPDLDSRVWVAANNADLCRSFLTSADPDGQLTARLLAALPRTPWHRGLTVPRGQALALVAPGREDAWRQVPSGERVLAAWRQREEAVSAYGRLLREAGSDATVAPHEALLSLLHLQHNRLYGIDPGHEGTVLALLRAALHQRGRAASG